MNQRHFRRRRTSNASIATLLLLTALAACSRQSGDTSASKPEAAGNRVPVRTTVIAIGSLPEVVSGYGSVSGGANSQASLAFPEAGRIKAVYVTIGDHVRAGTVLAQLDRGPFLAQEQETSAQLAAAQANYDKAVAQSQSSSTQLDVARTQLRRAERLFNAGVVSQHDVEIARAAVASAQAQLGVRGQPTQSRPDVEVAQAAITQARAALDAARQNVSYTSLVAPFDGIVVARFHNDGETVSTTDPVVELANDIAPVFTAQFAPGDAARIHTGEDATVNAQGVRALMDGRVVAINPAQSDQKTVPVLIALRGANRNFGPGAYGEASVVVGSRTGLVVPASAIVSDPATGSVQVFRRDEKHFTPVPVLVTASTHDRAIVSGQGLKPGDRVVVQGAYELLTPVQPAKPDTD